MLEAKKFKIDSRRRFRILTVIGCLLFYGFLFFHFTNLPPPSTTPALFSNQDGDNLKALVLDRIKGAQFRIALEIFGLTDKEVIAELNKKAEEGVAVSIRYDAKGSEQVASILSPSIQTTKVELNGLMHRKILIVDDAAILLGSANFTPSSLKFHDNILLSLVHPGLAQMIQKKEQKTFETEIDQQKLFFYLLPEKKGAVSGKMINYLSSAKKTIKVAMYTFTHPQFIEALIQAKNRGVDVEVALDYSMANGASHLAAKTFIEQGIPLMVNSGSHLLHHKWVWIDDETLIMGSANWTKSAFSRNEDFVLILENLSASQQEKLKNIWENTRKNQKVDFELKKKIAPAHLNLL